MVEKLLPLGCCYFSSFKLDPKVSEKDSAMWINPIPKYTAQIRTNYLERHYKPELCALLVVTIYTSFTDGKILMLLLLIRLLIFLQVLLLLKWYNEVVVPVFLNIFFNICNRRTMKISPILTPCNLK